MDARQSDVGVSLGVISQPVMDRAGSPMLDETLGELWSGDAPEAVATPRPTPKWPAVAILGGVALSGVWVGVLVWLLGRWIGVV